MRDWSQRHPRIVRFTMALVVFTGALWILYLVVAHPLIGAIYEGRGPNVLNSLITTQHQHPLSYFIESSDRIFYRDILFFPLAMFIFYSLVYLVFRFGLRSAVVHGGFDEISPDRIFRGDSIFAVSLYTLLTLLVFHSVLDHFTTHLIGPLEDNVRYLWNMWWGNQVLLGDGGALSFTNVIYYPEGSSLYFNDYSGYNLILSLILGELLPAPAIYNALIMHTFVLAGLGAFLLIRHLTRSSMSGLVGGFVFAFGSAHFAHALHHLNIASIQFIPFFVLYFIKSVRASHNRDTLLASLFFLLCALCSWTFLILNTVVILLSYVYLAYRQRTLILKSFMARAGFIVGCTIAVLSPWLVSMANIAFRAEQIGGGGHGDFVIDLAGLLIPGSLHWLNQWAAVEHINSAYSGNPWESAGYLGIVAIVLVVLMRRRVLPLAGVVVCAMFAFLLLSLGTYIHMFGQKLPVVLPFSILKRVPPLSELRAPGRAIIYAHLFWATLLGFAVRYLAESIRGQRLRFVIASLIVVLLITDHATPGAETVAIKLPPAYRALQGDGGDFGILELPGGWNQNGVYMMYQTLHGMPIVQGTLPRRVGVSLKDQLRLDDVPTLHKQLTENRVKYIVVHRVHEHNTWPVDVSVYEEQFTVVYRDDESLAFEVY